MAIAGEDFGDAEEMTSKKLGEHSAYIDHSFGPSSRRHGRRLSLPRPPTVDFQDQRPAKKGADQYEASEQTETDEGHFMCDGFHDIGGNQDLEAKQK
jgi:hypothetical protein